MHRFPFTSRALQVANIHLARVNRRLAPLLADNHPWRRATDKWSDTPLKFACLAAAVWQLGFLFSLLCSTDIVPLFGALYLLILAGWIHAFNPRWRQQTFSSPLAQMLHECFSQPDSYVLAASLLFGAMLPHHGLGPALLCLPIILYPFVREPAITRWRRLRQAYLMYREGHDLLLAPQVPLFLRRRVVHQPAPGNS